LHLGLFPFSVKATPQTVKLLTARASSMLRRQFEAEPTAKMRPRRSAMVMSPILSTIFPRLMSRRGRTLISTTTLRLISAAAKTLRKISAATTTLRQIAATTTLRKISAATTTQRQISAAATTLRQFPAAATTLRQISAAAATTRRQISATTWISAMAATTWISVAATTRMSAATSCVTPILAVALTSEGHLSKAASTRVPMVAVSTPTQLCPASSSTTLLSSSPDYRLVIVSQ